MSTDHLQVQISLGVYMRKSISLQLFLELSQTLTQEDINSLSKN